MVAARNAALMRHAENSFYFVKTQAHKAPSAKLIDESLAIPQCSFAARTCMPYATSKKQAAKREGQVCSDDVWRFEQKVPGMRVSS